MIVTFFGHSHLYHSEAQVRQWLTHTITSLIEAGADTFYLGGYGDFDRLAAKVVYEQKQLHPEIRSILILAYLNREQDLRYYDETIYPPLESVPLRYAIVRRNRWMVEQADAVVGYTVVSYGGAVEMVRAAERKKKIVLHLGEENP